MTFAECRFKRVVERLINDGIYPSPRQINIRLILDKAFKEHWAGYIYIKRFDSDNPPYGVYPPRYFNQDLKLHKHFHHSFDNISGRQCRWRREICFKIGFELKGKNLTEYPIDMI